MKKNIFIVGWLSVSLVTSVYANQNSGMKITGSFHSTKSGAQEEPPVAIKQVNARQSTEIKNSKEMGTTKISSSAKRKSGGGGSKNSHEID